MQQSTAPQDLVWFSPMLLFRSSASPANCRARVSMPRFISSRRFRVYATSCLSLRTGRHRPPWAGGVPCRTACCAPHGTQPATTGRALPAAVLHQPPHLPPPPPTCPNKRPDLPVSPPPPCDSPSGCCFFAGPWTVARSSLRMLCRVAAFCRPLRLVLPLVSFPRSRSPSFAPPNLPLSFCPVSATAPSPCRPP